MIEYVEKDDRENPLRFFRVSVRRMKIGDGIAVGEERDRIANAYEGQDTLLLALYSYPLLRYSSRLEISDTGEQYTETTLTEEVYKDLPEDFAAVWYEEVARLNPQYGVDQLKYLGESLAALLNRNVNINASQSGETNSSEPSTND